jgi:hypothetical protein
LHLFSELWDGRVAWIVRVVKTGAEGEGPRTDVMEINWPDSLDNIADLDVTLVKAKWLLASGFCQ